MLVVRSEKVFPGQLAARTWNDQRAAFGIPLVEHGQSGCEAIDGDEPRAENNCEKAQCQKDRPSP